MAETDKKTTELNSQSSFLSSLLFMVVDTTDLTMAATGTNKKMLASVLEAGLTLTNLSGDLAQSRITDLTSDLAAKEGTITAGTTAQYYRGDKSFQTLNQAAVAGLTTSDSPSFTGLTVGSLSGILKASTGTVATATAGTDYLTPTGSGAGLSGVVLTSGSYSSPSWLTAISGGIVSGNISGNAASITGSITTSQVSDLSSWTGSSAITTLGTIGTGTWQGTAIAGAYQDAMVGDSGSGGTKGAVPAPATGDAAAGKYLKADGTWAVPSGSVTSVAMTVPSWLSVAGSPITDSGTLAVSAATGMTANQILASPNGSSGAVSLRALVSADLPTTGVQVDSHYGTITSNTDGATITFDLSASDWHTVTLGGNRTLALTGGTTGQQFTITLVQDGTGSRTVTWWSGIKWPAATIPTLTTTAGKADVFTFKQTGTGAYYGFTAGQNL